MPKGGGLREAPGGEEGEGDRPSVGEGPEPLHWEDEDEDRTLANGPASATTDPLKRWRGVLTVCRARRNACTLLPELSLID